MKTHTRPTPILLLVTCLLAISMLLAACKAAAPTPTPTPTPEPLTPEQILERSKQASKDTPMHMAMDMEMKMNVMDQDMSISMKMNLDANSAEEAKMTMALDMLGQTFDSETIITGGKVYVKMPGSSEWTISDQSPADALKESEPVDLETMQNVTLVGEETLDGVPVYHFKAQVPFPESLTAQLGNVVDPMDIDYYVAKDTYLPVKLTGGGNLKIDIAGTETGMDFTLNATFSDWGKEVEISAPIQ